MGGFIQGIVVAVTQDSAIVESHVYVGSKEQKINSDAEAKFRELVQDAAGSEPVSDESMQSCVKQGYAEFEGKGSDHRTTMVQLTHSDSAWID